MDTQTSRFLRIHYQVEDILMSQHHQAGFGMEEHGNPAVEEDQERSVGKQQIPSRWPAARMR
jgi:hypothetical protein